MVEAYRYRGRVQNHRSVANGRWKKCALLALDDVSSTVSDAIDVECERGQQRRLSGLVVMGRKVESGKWTDTTTGGPPGRLIFLGRADLAGHPYSLDSTLNTLPILPVVAIICQRLPKFPVGQ